MFKFIRVAILLSVLLVVAVGRLDDASQDWSKPIYVGLYPINADGDPKVDRYIAALDAKDFKPLEGYFKDQASRYNAQAYVYYFLGDRVEALPPKVPRDSGVWQAMAWSLKFRYYAYKHRPSSAVKPNLTLFLQYHSPNRRLLSETSTALQNGRIGVVNLFADPSQNQSNNVVIAHESLHAFGASDKYDLATGMPLYPDGYADASSGYPQQKAELMAMHKAISPTRFEMARRLDETIVGKRTAAEIGWTDQKP